MAGEARYNKRRWVNGWVRVCDAVRCVTGKTSASLWPTDTSHYSSTQVLPINHWVIDGKWVWNNDKCGKKVWVYAGELHEESACMRRGTALCSSVFRVIRTQCFLFRILIYQCERHENKNMHANRTTNKLTKKLIPAVLVWDLMNIATCLQNDCRKFFAILFFRQKIARFRLLIPCIHMIQKVSCWT